MAAVALAMLAQVLPPSLERCHCSVGVGVPTTVTLKAAALPAVVVWALGCALMVAATGVGSTVSVTPLLVTEPALLLTTTR